MKLSESYRREQLPNYYFLDNYFLELRRQEDELGIPSTAVDRSDCVPCRRACSPLAIPVRRTVPPPCRDSVLFTLIKYVGLGGAV